LNRPELTAEKFVANPFDDRSGSQMYRTGDLVRRLSDGNILFIGRIDNQLKIRGHRVELGEIETTLCALDGVAAAAVVYRTDLPANRRMAAYIVARNADGGALDESGRKEAALRCKRQLAGRLPSYMVPNVLVCLDALPLTDNGKIDKRALPLPREGDFGSGEYVAPRTQLEERLSEIWADALQVERVGVDDNFFELGGESLIAMSMVSEVRRTLRLETNLATVLEHPTVAGLAKALADSNQLAATLSDIVARDRAEARQLSFAQRRLWFIDQLEGGSPHYNMPGAFRLSGRLDTAAFRRSLESILRRHEVLRTRFVAAKDEPRPEVVEEFSLPLMETDLSMWPEQEKKRRVESLAQEDARKPFDLSTDLALRMHLLRLADEEHVMLFNMHHIASDGWSTGILVREFGELYDAFTRGKGDPLVPLRVQYADYAAWQRGWLRGELLEKQLGYWRRQLAGIPQLHALPLDKPRPAHQTYFGGSYNQVIDKETTARIKELCRAKDVTLFMLMHTVFSVLLGRYSGEHDIVIGSPIAGRAHSDVEALIGFFVNNLVLRTDLSDNPTFSELLQRNKETILAAYEHQHIPFEMLVEELRPQRTLAHSPLFQIQLSLDADRSGSTTFELGSLKIDEMPSALAAAAKFDLILAAGESGDEIKLLWLYSADIFFPETIQRIASSYCVLLDSAWRKPDTRIAELDVMTAEERRSLLG
jgi:acyl carrier protein